MDREGAFGADQLRAEETVACACLGGVLGAFYAGQAVACDDRFVTGVVVVVVVGWRHAARLD